MRGQGRVLNHDIEKEARPRILVNLPKAKTEHEKTAISRQIQATDRQIDQLVYELYGLTEDEIRIVEGG